MRYARTPLLCAGALAGSLVLTATALAAQPLCGGAAQATVQPPAADPALVALHEMQAEMNAAFGGDLARLIAAQEASMQAMLHEIDAMMARAFQGPPGSFEVALPPGGRGETSQILVSSFSSGQGTCSETVTYGTGADGRPQMVVQKTGNACGTVTFGNGMTPAVTAPQAPRTIQVDTPTIARPHYLHG